MINKILILCFVLGILIFANSTWASETSILQPAIAITYNEELVVNGTARFDSIYVGKQNVGGVTFFNRTIINSTTGDQGYNNPVTFGDNVRIDGGIFRTEVGHPNALNIWDSLEPGLTLANNIGSASL